MLEEFDPDWTKLVLSFEKKKKQAIKTSDKKQAVKTRESAADIRLLS